MRETTKFESSVLVSACHGFRFSALRRHFFGHVSLCANGLLTERYVIRYQPRLARDSKRDPAS